jgi:hypothetical protein
MAIWLSALVFLILATVVVLGVKYNSRRRISESAKPVHVVLIGASIGQGWHLADWPARAKVLGFTAESIPVWQFDKTEAVEEVLMRPTRKFRLTRSYVKSLTQPPPRQAAIVILKECSSYFPGDLASYKRSVKKWVNQLQAKKIEVMLATVVPVTNVRAHQSPGKQESLVEYNEWVRQYAQQHGIRLLDLESALRTDEFDRYLRDEFATSDGSHLNAAAYAVLDDLLCKKLCRNTLGGTTAETQNNSRLHANVVSSRN